MRNPIPNPSLTRTTQSLLRPVIIAIIFLAGVPLCWAEPPALIPRELLFGETAKSPEQISPDGSRIAYIAPDDKKTLQLWVKTTGKEDGKQLTHEKLPGVTMFGWAADGKSLVYFSGPCDMETDLNGAVMLLDLSTGIAKKYGPFPGFRGDPAVTQWADNNQQIRVEQKRNPDTGIEIHISDNPAAPWKTWLTTGPVSGGPFAGY
jgi:hypothetical protein